MSTYKLTIAAAFSVTLVALAAPAFAAGQLAYCKADAERLCPGVRPGGGALKNCLKEHENEVSIGCGKELKKLKAEMGK
ncbi:cysteine rich repeat-containing protein [Roseiarcus sp.]|uniref:cysteine rich repeat-containing protein n=1 Tax=Roseiarcus sp. TaxID=1969460 RepID=UPI003F97A657